MKIAIPHEDGRLHGRFGGCREFALVEVDLQNKVMLRTDILPAPEHQPGLFPRWLREQGVEVVIAGGIGRRALAIFAQHGITVRAGLPETGLTELVAAYLNGQLTLTPDGCEHHDDHDHHGHAPSLLTDEMREAGFQFRRRLPPPTEDRYALLFEVAP